MSTTVAQMTVEELKALVRDTVKETFLEILRDPDIGLELRPEFQSRLRTSQAYIKSGGKLISWDDMLHRLNSK
jgi:hypothetical protein